MSQVTNEVTSYTSGTIVSQDGLIVAPGPSTVPNKPSKIVVALTGGKKLDAKRMVVDKRSNLTLLKVEGDDLVHLQAEKASPEIGDEIICVSAYDMNGKSVTRGIVAATDRSISDDFPKLLQTDVNVGLMSSGGPILNHDGKLVGVVVARSEGKLSTATFAIPALHIAAILDEAGDSVGPKVVRKPFLGVQLSDGPAEKHAMVVKVVPDSPAEKAEIHAMDLILSIEGTRVDSAHDAQHEIAKKKANESVTLRILREGKEQDVTAKLADRNSAGDDPNTTRISFNDLRIVSPSEVIILGNKRVGKLTKPKEGSVGSFWFRKPDSAHPLRAPTVRVERSGIDKRVKELGDEMNELSAQISKLTKAVTKLQEEIEKTSHEE